MKRSLVLVLVLALAGCAAPRRPAPVVERLPAAKPAPAAARPVVPQTPVEHPETHVVKRGDTLYGIALDYGLDYRELAEWNGIANPNVIREGQVLRTRPPAEPASSAVQVSPIAGVGTVPARPLSMPAEAAKPAAAPRAEPAAPRAEPAALKTEPRAVKLPYSEENLALLTKPAAAPEPEPRVQQASAAPSAAAVKPEPEPKADLQTRPEPASKPATAAGGDEGVEWSWPATGRVLARFSDPANKGVDISGKKGEPVYATAGGRVVYSGEGLRGYGKLIIIKHNNTYLSAYAHNDSILVREGQTVVKGQKIAEIGSTGTDQTKLHFEIRRMGKPVDPLKFLPERPS